MMLRLCALLACDAAEAWLSQSSVHDMFDACRIQYTSGEFEDLDLTEIIKEGHMSLICQ